MKTTSLILNSMRFYWRSHLGVFLGVLLTTAVLTGSLLVGDSVDGSLRTFALQRLGSIHYALHTPSRFVSRNLAERISGDAAAVLHLRGMGLAGMKQVNRVQVLGCDANLWKFAGLDFQLSGNEVAMNEKLASALGVDVGGEVSLRIEKPGLLSRDAPFSPQRDDRTVRGRFTVVRILSDDELGRFSLSPSQMVPYNVFVDFRWLEERVELTGKANLVVAGEGDPSADFLRNWRMEDFGLRLWRKRRVDQLESDRIYLDAETASAAMRISGAEGTLTYLVNSISKDRKSTPYSFIVAREGLMLETDEIIINSWLANELDAKVGDTITMKYSELLSSNRFVERERTFVVRSVVEMDELLLERKLAPQFPGLMDVRHCTEWDIGIPLEESKLEDAANEEYWNRYRQTPKAIISLEAGQAMWANRFGNLTSVRWTRIYGIEEAFRERFDPVSAGFVFQPVRKQALEAVDNAMDFGQLFLGMSFFLIVAALMLTGLLFVFGVQQRAEEMGILLATGWRPVRVRNVILGEGVFVALLGSMIGAWAGTGYTKLLLFGLASHWQGAVAHSAIRYFAKPGTIFTGMAISFVCAIIAMGIAAWRQTKHPPRELLMADFTQEFQPLTKNSTGKVAPSVLFSILGGVGAVGFATYPLVVDVQSATMPFFGAGALLLVSGMLVFRILLHHAGRLQRLAGMGSLAVRNMARRSGRSLTVAGLLACGSFLVFSVSSMKEDVAAHASEAWSGTGGFIWFGESTLPISDNLGGVQLRVHDGDDASCLNLNRARSPRLLGVDPDAMSERKAFLADEDVWQLLKLELPDGMVPALTGDADTAMWGLEAKTGVERGTVLDYIDEAGKPFKVKLVGRLPMRLSVFQGSILIAENNFVERFPGEEGYRIFLFDRIDGISTARKYERAGLDVVSSTERLREFHAVESTYMTMFLVLGALGLAFGSMGMGVVVLRNVQDRRVETALLRAVGYKKGDLRRLLVVEHGLLLVVGLAAGSLAALVAMVPALFMTHVRTSITFLCAMLAVVAAFGLVCMAAAIEIALRGDVLRGLRNE